MPAAIPAIAGGVASAAVGSALNKNKGGGSSTSTATSEPWSGIRPYLVGSSERKLKPGVEPIYDMVAGEPQWVQTGTGEYSDQGYWTQGTPVQRIINPDSDYIQTGSPGIYDEGQRLYEQGLGFEYPDQQMAPMDPWQTQGLNTAALTGQGYAGLSQSLANPLTSMGLGLLSGGGTPMGGGGMAAMPSVSYPQTTALQSIMSGSNNPYLDQMAGNLSDKLGDLYSEQLLPGIRSGAVSAGQMGSSRQGVAEGIAAKALGEQGSEMLTNLYGQAYESDRNRMLQAALGSRGQDVSVANANLGASTALAPARWRAGIESQQLGLQALGMLPGMLGMGITGAGAMTGTGDAYNAYAQSQLNMDRQNILNQQAYPWQNLSNYASIIQPGAGIGGSTTQTVPLYGNSGAQALGMGLMGARAFGDMFGGGWTNPGIAGNAYGTETGGYYAGDLYGGGLF